MITSLFGHRRRLRQATIPRARANNSLSMASGVAPTAPQPNGDAVFNPACGDGPVVRARADVVAVER